MPLWNLAITLVVAGLVVLVTSLASVALTALAAAAIASEVLSGSRLVPTVAQLLHAPTILLGCVAGGAILTLMMYLNFASVVKITTENLTAVMAFSPVTVWAFQEVGVMAGLIDAGRPEPRVVAVMVVCIAAVLMIIAAGVRKLEGLEWFDLLTQQVEGMAAKHLHAFGPVDYGTPQLEAAISA